MAKKSSSQLIVLSLLAIVSLALYLGYNLPNRWQYALENRALSLIAIVITGAAIALATMIFQTVVNNRILTPSILGLDSLYLLIQTAIIFLFGSSTLLSMNSIALFVLCTGLMMAFSRPNANTSKQCQYFKLKTMVATKMANATHKI